MEVVTISESAIRIKGKQMAAIVVDADNSVKTKTPAADAALFLKRGASEISSKVEEVRLSVNGPGEYEVSGIKISAFGADSFLMYTIRIDNMDVLIVSSDALGKFKDKAKQCDVLIISAGKDTDLSSISAFEPSIVLVYGPSSIASLDSLGKKELRPVAKYAVLKDKLPTEMEVVVLQ